MGQQRDALRSAIEQVFDAAGIERVWTADGLARGGDAVVLALGEADPTGRCTLLRAALPSEGRRTTMNFVDASLHRGELDPRTWMWIGSYARSITRIRRREAALASIGYDRTAAPAWSMCAHPVLPALAATMDMTVEEYLAHFSWTPGPKGFQGASPERTAGQRLSEHEISRCADVLSAERFVRRVDAADGCLVEAKIENAARPWDVKLRLLVDHVLPETVVAAARGLDLADVMDLGTAPVRGAKIATMSQSEMGGEHQIDIVLAPALAPLADPPAGIARDWLTQTPESALEDPE